KITLGEKMKLNKSLRFNIYPRELLFSIFLIMLPFSLFYEKRIGTGLISYTDEALAVICILYIVYFSFKKGIKSTDLVLIILLIATVLITLLGNVIYRLTSNWFSVAVDAICLAKMFVTFIVYKQVATYDKRELIIRYLLPIAKLLLISGSVCGFISLFVDIGMTGGKRYGIPSFYFLFNNEARYGYIVACCLLVVLVSENNKRKKSFYEFLCIFNIVLTTKGSVYIVLVCYLILTFMWRNKQKLSPANIFVLAVGGTLASSMQINTYIRDQESPRMVLLRYGFKTANTYFPFGSGFATYGSDQAAQNYSVLYTKYGFENRYGLSQDYGAFLNDCYLGMVVGEFGYIGMVLFLAMLIMVFIPINRIILDKKVKALTLALFIGIVVSSVGTAIIKSSGGVFVFAFFGLICGYSQNRQNRGDGTTLTAESKNSDSQNVGNGKIINNI
ncbi:MAG: hypothetical protein LUG95_04230, partial [Clostridiales bacterium]|nr:hypothetical protein [Clostridiales bacterium]